MAGDAVDGDWERVAAAFNEASAEALERHMETQGRFVEAWVDAMQASMTDESVEEGVESYVRAYETWMDAAEQSLDRLAEATASEEIPDTEIRDIWLDAANESFKEIMGSSAFAAATGQAVEEAMDAQTRIGEASQQTLRELGMATRDDVQEVGERLVELERRQQRIEAQLEDVLARLEGRHEEGS